MTKEEAIALATKREAHKSKFMTNKRWEAIHDSVKGWHVALVDDPLHVRQEATERARKAFRQGDLQSFLDASSDAMMAGIREALSASAQHASTGLFSRKGGE